VKYKGWQLQTPSCGTVSAEKAQECSRGEPSFAGPEAPLRSRFRLRRLGKLSGARLFFNARPFLLDPALDFPFVPFDGFSLWLLRTPSQRVEQTADMIHMVTDAKEGKNQLGDSGTSPKICGKSCGLRSPEKIFLQLFFGLGSQTGRAAWCRFGFNATKPNFQEDGFPSPDASAIDLELLGNFDRLKAVFEKGNGTEPSLFQDLWASRRSHSTPPAQSIGHYLCRSQ